MFRIEFILKGSTADEISETWVNSGKVNNVSDSHFIFDDVDSWSSDKKIMTIYTKDGIYIYNISDFYRIKITEVK